MTMPDSFRFELSEWQRIRRSFPGWLVLPKDNRVILVRDIERSLLENGLASALLCGNPSDWPVEVRLIAWSELNWRLERALVPLRTEWAERIEAVLVEVAPFPELIRVAQGFFASTACGFACRHELRSPWIDLALALLRHCREFHRANAFQAWQFRLAPLDQDWDEVHHQRAYHNALWHLTFMNDADALAVTKGWDAERGGDPYWLARKAGLLAELGRGEDAHELWTDCLRGLQGLAASTAPFFSTSREAAVRSALLQLSWGDKALERGEIEDRLRVLSGIDGSTPWDDLSALTKPDLEFREQQEEMEANPNSVHWAGSSLWQPLAGVQALRLCEEYGFPLVSFGDGFPISLYISRVLAESFADLALASEDLAGTSLMRMRNGDFWKKRLDAAHMAVLPDTLLAALVNACDNAWAQVAIPQPSPGHLERATNRACDFLHSLRWRLESVRRHYE